MVEQRRKLRPEQLAADHLRRRRQRRVRLHEPDVAVQRVHVRLRRRKLREWSSDEVGDHHGADRRQRRGGGVLLAPDRRSESRDCAERADDAPDLLGRAARLALVGLRGRGEPDRSSAGHHA